MTTKHLAGLVLGVALFVGCGGGSGDDAAAGNAAFSGTGDGSPPSPANACAEPSIGGPPKLVVHLSAEEHVIVAQLSGNDAACFSSLLGGSLPLADTTGVLGTMTMQCTDATACTIRLPIDQPSSEGTSDVAFANIEGPDVAHFTAIFRLPDGKAFESRAEMGSGGVEVECHDGACSVVVATSDGEVPDLPVAVLVDPPADGI